MSTYQPWVGKLDDGTEVLVSLCVGEDVGGDWCESVEVAFRAKPHHTWGPPVEMRKAP